MSDEFVPAGPHAFFHNVVADAARQYQERGHEIMRLWGLFLQDFQPVAQAVASCAAGDSGVTYPIQMTMRQLDTLGARLIALREYIAPFEEIAREAIAAKAQGKPVWYVPPKEIP